MNFYFSVRTVWPVNVLFSLLISVLIRKHGGSATAENVLMSKNRIWLPLSFEHTKIVFGHTVEAPQICKVPFQLQEDF